MARSSRGGRRHAAPTGEAAGGAAGEAAGGAAATARVANEATVSSLGVTNEASLPVSSQTRAVRRCRVNEAPVASVCLPLDPVYDTSTRACTVRSSRSSSTLVFSTARNSSWAVAPGAREGRFGPAEVASM